MEKNARRKDPSIRITLSQFKSFFKNKVRAKRMFIKLGSLNCKRRLLPEGQSFESRSPKLSRVLNPGSKYYDDTPKITKQLSLLWFNHQKNKGRISTKRITQSDRQWAILSRIKVEMIRVSTELNVSFPVLAQRVFNVGESIASNMGKKSIYLTTLFSHLDEIFDKVESSLLTEVTSLEIEIFENYSERREAVTGRKWKSEVVPGSDEHHIVKRIAEITKEYRLGVDRFMDIQFEAFKVFDSFPRLKNLITDSAIDRLDQSLSRDGGEGSEEDREYWNDIRKSNLKNR